MSFNLDGFRISYSAYSRELNIDNNSGYRGVFKDNQITVYSGNYKICVFDGYDQWEEAIDFLRGRLVNKNINK